MREEALFHKICHFSLLALGGLAWSLGAGRHCFVWPCLALQQGLRSSRPRCRGVPCCAVQQPCLPQQPLGKWFAVQDDTSWAESPVKWYAELVPVEGRCFGYSFSYIWQGVAGFGAQFLIVLLRIFSM